MPRVMTTLLFVLLGCWGRTDPFTDRPRREPAPTFSPAVDTTGAGAVSQLWRMPGRYELPDTSLPPSFAGRTDFPVELGRWPVGTKKVVSVWEAPSPFLAELDGRRSAPAGMKLFVGDQEARYHPGLQGKSWAIRDGKILVAWDPELDRSTVRVQYDGAWSMLQRRERDASGLTAEAFVQYELTLSSRTRPGLLVPAPGRASYTIDVPPGATVDTHVALAPSPLAALGSTGAAAVIEVEVDGETHEVARVALRPSDDGFTPIRADLSAWSGRSVTLHLSSEPGADPYFDHVFFGSPTVAGAPSGEPRRIIVIGLDTTRPDHFSFYGYRRPTTPELDVIAGQSVVFDNAFTPAPRTRPSFRSATTGRRPLDAVGAKNLGEVFSEHGFATAGIVANVHLQPRFDFQRGFDDWWYEGGARAELQVDRALDFLDRYRDRDVYMFLHIMDPHLYYNAPEPYLDMFAETKDPSLPEQFSREEVLEWMEAGPLDPVKRAHIEARYDGELRYTSAQLGRFFDQLDRLGGRTLVVVHNDHGEEFWEHGSFEHNQTLYQEVVGGLLWFRANGGLTTGFRSSVPATLADIAPTLYDFAAIPSPPPTDGVSLRPYIEGADGAVLADRPIGMAHLRYGLDRWGVVWKNKKYILISATGQEEFYDLEADPLEKDDLARKTDLEPWRAQLGPVHGMPVSPGWRIFIDLDAPGGDPFELRLPRPAVDAFVLRPAMTIPNPRNEEWGEPPRRSAEEIGTVERLEGGTLVRFTPGTDPKEGVLFVRFDEAVSPDDLVMTRGDQPLVFIRSSVWTWSDGDASIRIAPGTVFSPPPSEVARMRAASGGEASAEDIAKLCMLGYVEGPICEGADAHSDH